MSTIAVDSIEPATSGKQVLFPQKPAFTAHRNSGGDISSGNVMVFNLSLIHI